MMIGVGGFIFEGDEHRAFGRARHLPDQHEARAIEMRLPFGDVVMFRHGVKRRAVRLCRWN
jgi:hypothetical protein